MEINWNNAVPCAFNPCGNMDYYNDTQNNEVLVPSL